MSLSSLKTRNPPNFKILLIFFIVILAFAPFPSCIDVMGGLSPGFNCHVGFSFIPFAMFTMQVLGLFMHISMYNDASGVFSSYKNHIISDIVQILVVCVITPFFMMLLYKDNETSNQKNNLKIAIFTVIIFMVINILIFYPLARFKILPYETMIID